LYFAAITWSEYAKAEITAKKISSKLTDRSMLDSEEADLSVEKVMQKVELGLYQAQQVLGELLELLDIVKGHLKNESSDVVLFASLLSRYKNLEYLFYLLHILDNKIKFSVFREIGSAIYHALMNFLAYAPLHEQQ
jgi:hypothetical protein